MRKLLLSILVALGLGYGVGRHLQPAKIETKTKEIEVIKHDIKTVTKIVERPDGTKETVIVVDDKTVEDRTKESSTVVVNTKPQYRLRGGFGYDVERKGMEYSGGFEKRFWGPLSLGVEARLDGNSKLQGGEVTASWEF